MSKIKLIIADIDNLIDKKESILAQIVPSYAGKYEKKKKESDKLSELAAGYLLLKYLGVSEDSQLYFNDHHKPYLVDKSIQFNLSHGERFVALVVADFEIGVDIERIRPYTKAVADRVFTEEKKAVFDTLEGEAKDNFYSKSWTEVEAYLKCKGVGFDEGWKNINTAEANMYSLLHEDYYVSICASDKDIDIEKNLEIIYE